MSNPYLPEGVTIDCSRCGLNDQRVEVAVEHGEGFERDEEWADSVIVTFFAAQCRHITHVLEVGIE